MIYIPNINGNMPNSWQPNHQPVVFCSLGNHQVCWWPMELLSLGVLASPGLRAVDPWTGRALSQQVSARSSAFTWGTTRSGRTRELKRSFLESSGEIRENHGKNHPKSWEKSMFFFGSPKLKSNSWCCLFARWLSFNRLLGREAQYPHGSDSPYAFWISKKSNWWIHTRGWTPQTFQSYSHPVSVTILALTFLRPHICCTFPYWWAANPPGCCWSSLNSSWSDNVYKYLLYM